MKKISYLTEILCCMTLILILSGCGKHCYLCQGIPCNAPCLVDLSTGQVIELSVDNDPGAVIWTYLGTARLSFEPNRVSAIIPTDDRETDCNLFCNDCQALLSELPNGGYVIADMLDLNNLSLFPAQAEGSYTIREYEITVMTNPGGSSVVITKAP